MDYTDVIKIIDWKEEINFNGRYAGMSLSKDLEDALSRYLFQGLEPGGHLTALLAHDYERALYNADIHSRTCFWATAMWIIENVPPAAHGSYDNVHTWCKNEQARDAYRLDREQAKMWNILKEKNE